MFHESKIVCPIINSNNVYFDKIEKYKLHVITF